MVMRRNSGGSCFVRKRKILFDHPIFYSGRRKGEKQNQHEKFHHDNYWQDIVNC